MPLAYTGEAESARRKFERDKDELKTMGLSLLHIAPGETIPGGRVSPDHLYVPEEDFQLIPDPGLSQQDARLLSRILYRAIQTRTREGNSRDATLLESVARKVLFQHPDALSEFSADPSQPEVSAENDPEEDTDNPGTVHSVLKKGERISFAYPSRDGTLQVREVDGRGLLSNRGRWCLVGHSYPDGKVKMYYLDRMKSVQSTGKPVRPAPGFKLKDFSLHPLALGIQEEPVRVEVRLTDESEELFLSFLDGLPERFYHKRMEDRMVFETTNRDALYSWMVRNPGSVSNLGPESVRLGFIQYLEKMKQIHEEGPDE